MDMDSREQRAAAAAGAAGARGAAVGRLMAHRPEFGGQHGREEITCRGRSCWTCCLSRISSGATTTARVRQWMLQRCGHAGQQEETAVDAAYHGL